MRAPVALALLVIGCGPVVDAAAETGSSSTADATTATTVATSTGTPQPDPDPDPESDSDPDSTGAPGPTTDDVDDSSSSEAEDATIGCGFICEPDGGVVYIECDVWTQDCPRGEKCMPWANDGGSSWNATKCTPLDETPAHVGDPCMVEDSALSGIDDCELGAMCFGVDEATNEGTCVAMCEGNEANPTCDDGSTCALSGDSVLALCLPTCEPLIQACAEGDGCYPVGDTFMCVPVFEPGAFGDPCESIAGCDPGLFCAPPDAVPACAGDIGCCSSFCDFAEMNASQTCPGVAGGQECVLWYEEGQAAPGFEDVGACVIPP